MVRVGDQPISRTVSPVTVVFSENARSFRNCCWSARGACRTVAANDRASSGEASPEATARARFARATGAAPVVRSYAFDLFGQTAYGYGASTSAFAVFGALAVFGTVVLVEHRRLGRVAGGGAAALLACIGGAVGADIAAASPATAVHQAGFGFGVLVGVVGVALLWWRGEAVVAGVGARRRSTASSEGP